MYVGAEWSNGSSTRISSAELVTSSSLTGVENALALAGLTVAPLGIGDDDGYCGGRGAVGLTNRFSDRLNSDDGGARNTPPLPNVSSSPDVCNDGMYLLEVDESENAEKLDGDICIGSGNRKPL